jgi:L-alanine-DL-glutamate epimerase-like enolase superfamily enzyme
LSAFAASVQPFAGLERHELCEFPAEPKALAFEVTSNHLMPEGDGLLRLAEEPGLGMAVDPRTIARYVVDMETRAKGKTLYRTP